MLRTLLAENPIGGSATQVYRYLQQGLITEEAVLSEARKIIRQKLDADAHEVWGREPGDRVRALGELP